MRTTLFLALVLILTGCVRILQHDPLSPTRANAEAVFEAMAQSRFLREREAGRVASEIHIRENLSGLEGPAVPLRPLRATFPLTGCLVDGGAFALEDAEIRDDGVCGVEAGQRRCLAWSDMTAIGRPRDAVVPGYFPVTQFLGCEELA